MVEARPEKWLELGKPPLKAIPAEVPDPLAVFNAQRNRLDSLLASHFANTQRLTPEEYRVISDAQRNSEELFSVARETVSNALSFIDANREQRRKE